MGGVPAQALDALRALLLRKLPGWQGRLKDEYLTRLLEAEFCTEADFQGVDWPVLDRVKLPPNLLRKIIEAFSAGK
jgi:hypothetical protein